MRRHLNRIVGGIAAAILCIIALALGAPASGATIKIAQTCLLLTAVILLGFTSLRKTGIPTKIFAGLVLGAVAGLIYGPDAEIIKPLGTAFIRLIKMVVVPLIFASLLVGVASLGDLRKGLRHAQRS